MQVINACSAGIDVGSRFHMVAVDQDPKNVRQFGVYHQDHVDMITWFKERNIRTIAMESTGSYWQTLFDALQRAAFKVQLVNGSQIKNVKGKKTDVLDCLWIQKLHTLGLLTGSFLPAADFQSLRTYYNHRNHLISQCSKYINKMQKALRLMNVRLDIVNDIMGLSGRTIITAILNGERDAVKLASLANYRVKKSREEIAKALEGNWRDDLLFELQECLCLHDVYCEKLQACDVELGDKISALQGLSIVKDVDFKRAKSTRQRNKYNPAMDIEQLCFQYYGTNLMQIQGVGSNTLLSLLIQIGDRIHQFPTSKHFCSWLRLAPNNKVSGGKTLSSRTPKGKNQFALALRQAANSIGSQKSGELLHFFKRVAYKKGRASAITATARKLATIIYNMLIKKEDYKPSELPPPSNRVKNKIIKNIRTKMSQLELTKEQLIMLLEGCSLSVS